MMDCSSSSRCPSVEGNKSRANNAEHTDRRCCSGHCSPYAKPRRYCACPHSLDTTWTCLAFPPSRHLNLFNDRAFVVCTGTAAVYSPEAAWQGPDECRCGAGLPRRHGCLRRRPFVPRGDVGQSGRAGDCVCLDDLFLRASGGWSSSFLLDVCLAAATARLTLGSRHWSAIQLCECIAGCTSFVQQNRVPVAIHGQ